MELLMNCLELFFAFFKIGLFTFGGGYAMLPLIQEETLARGWVDQSELINFIAVSESTPGPFAVNMATYIGTEESGFFGAFAATLGVILPSFIIILIVAKCYERFQKNKIVKGCLSGIKPTAIGLIGAAVVSVAGTVFFHGGFHLAVFSDISFYISAVIFLIMTVLAFYKVHPIVLIVSSAAIGVAVGYGCNLSV